VPIFSISVVNRHFTSSNEQDLPTLADAKAHAIQSALEMGIEEVSEDKPIFGAQVNVDSGNECVARFVVAIGVSPIQ